MLLEQLSQLRLWQKTRLLIIKAGGKKMHEEDFVKEELIEFEIEGKKFKYRPTTANDELNWAEEYIEIVDGKPKQNLGKVTKCKMRNLIEVPYDQETIKKIIGVDKPWGSLTHKERWDLIGKLKPKVFDKIITNINEIDSPNEDVKKN